MPAYEVGHRGGRLAISQRAEPKTFNPVLALDAPSRDIIRRMMADLVSINRVTQAVEPNLASSWRASRDGLSYTVTLRDGLRFSDGAPCDADDVVFTFRVYMDEKIASPQRDMLLVGGKPMQVTKLDRLRVRFDLASPYAAAERIFDSIAILPRHVLEPAYKEGRFAQTWGLAAEASTIVGLGPFRLKQFRPGERVVLERNPFYWKRDRAGTQLPYLDQLEFVILPAEEAQVIRFAAGETSILNRFSARSLPLLGRDDVMDAGAGLEYNFLFFNLGPASRPWFSETAFRQAVSAAIDREAIVRLVFAGRAAPLWTHVPPGNHLWINQAIAKPERSIPRARKLLASAGYSWDGNGNLVSHAGEKVSFSILVGANNPDRVQMAGLIQEDLRQLGMEVQIAQLEFRSVLDRITRSRQFDAAVIGLGGGDSDPNSEMSVWLSSGAMHLWNPSQKQPATSWEAEIDRLMQAQLIERDFKRRKQMFDRVQAIEAEQLPLISLASPHVLVAAHRNVGNVRPGVLDHYTLWNCEYLFLREGASK